VLKPAGSLLVACHLGSGAVHQDDWWGHRLSVDFWLFERAELERLAADAGFDLVQTLERDPIPEVEYQSRRVYLLARKPAR
jgi:hypothetical protein